MRIKHLFVFVVVLALGCALAVTSTAKPAAALGFGVPAPLVAAAAGVQVANHPVAGWSLQSPPSLGEVPSGHLTAVSCLTRASCVAVGYSRDVAGVDVTLIESFDGVSWSIQPSPNPEGNSNSFLTGVQCFSSRACLAVGDYNDPSGKQLAMAERFDGHRWEIETIPGPPGQDLTYMTALSCSSASACTAVGYSQRGIGDTVTVAVRWNGTTWQLQPTPNVAGGSSSRLLSVSCPAVSECMSVGDSGPVFGGQALAEHWDGIAWTIKALANPAGANISALASVSCPSVHACKAVGSWNGAEKAGGALIESWDATAWAVQSTPTGRTDVLGRVSCSANTACIAVGSGPAGPLALRFDGTAWVAIAASTDGDGSLSCTAADACTGVGGTHSDFWNGATWTTRSTPSPLGAAGAALNNVSCPTDEVCVAVGHYINNQAQVVPMIERWQNHMWRLQAAPLPVSSRLNSLSCVAVDACTAVGYTFDEVSGHAATMVLHWDGHSWQLQPSPNPPGPAALLQNVSCNRPDGSRNQALLTVCTAVGSEHDNLGGSNAFAERWDGHSWHLQNFAMPAGTNVSLALGGISCPTAIECTTVGIVRTGCTLCFGDPGHQPPPGPCDTGCLIAEHWDGSGWAFVLPPNPKTSVFDSLDDVSCPSSGTCMAVGQWGPEGRSAAHPGITLAESLTGGQWEVNPTPDPPGVGEPGGSELSPFAAVSCATPTSCTAVGYYANANVNANRGSSEGLAEHWNGSGWTVQPMPTPAGSNVYGLAGVSCPTTHMCMAVGTHERVNRANSDAGPLLGLAELYLDGQAHSSVG